MGGLRCQNEPLEEEIPWNEVIILRFHPLVFEGGTSDEAPMEPILDQSINHLGSNGGFAIELLIVC